METTHEKACPPSPVSLSRAFFYWLKLGFISFGGPAGQISIMHHDLVEQKRWISDRRFLHALNYCMLLPGPEAQQLAVYIGWLMHRTWGGIVAGVLFILPSFFILVGLSWAYMAHGNQPVVVGALHGIKPAVVAIVCFAAYRIGSRTLKNPLLWGITTMAFMAIFLLKLPFPLIILGAAFIGLVGTKLFPSYLAVTGTHNGKMKHYGPALIDDHTPTPVHARFSKIHLFKVATIGLLIWLLAMGLLIQVWGRDSLFVRMGCFFTKASLLTFGGAYAVLPYVYQGAVDSFHWLSPNQMMDGLALGETTPGPLIMVVTYVGFVSGWGHAGSISPFVTALLVSIVVTFFTFLPSFIFIFLGGPFIETTHGNLSLSAPLTAITAAVVGVILSLGAFFAYHTIWSHGWGQAIDGFSLLLVGAALFALIRLKANVIAVILTCAITGFFYYYL